MNVWVTYDHDPTIVGLYTVHFNQLDGKNLLRLKQGAIEIDLYLEPRGMGIVAAMIGNRYVWIKKNTWIRKSQECPFKIHFVQEWKEDQ